MKVANGERLAFLCDFDGTVCPTQMLDFLYQRFAASGMEFAERWERGEISTQEEIESTFATVQASRQEMEAALEIITIDPDFPRFLEFCRHHDYPLAIVSDGLEWYIEYILIRHGIHGVQIYANQIFFEPKGFRFEFPWFDKETPMRGVCKPMIVRRYQERGMKVIFIGDGMSDFDVVGVADVLFVRGQLAKYTQEHDIPAIIFNGCSNLMDKLKEMDL